MFVFNSYFHFIFFFLRLNGNNLFDNMKMEGIWIIEDSEEFIEVLKKLQKDYVERNEK